MNCKIAIFGDSWACGVWDNIKDEYRISHLGINHFLFANNYHATNFARPGSCNSENINTLEKYHNDFDIKIFLRRCVIIVCPEPPANPTPCLFLFLFLEQKL